MYTINGQEAALKNKIWTDSYKNLIKLLEKTTSTKTGKSVILKGKEEPFKIDSKNLKKVDAAVVSVKLCDFMILYYF